MVTQFQVISGILADFKTPDGQQGSGRVRKWSSPDVAAVEWDVYLAMSPDLGRFRFQIALRRDGRIDIIYLQAPVQFFNQKVPVPVEGGGMAVTPLSQLHKLALNHDVAGGMTEALDVKGQLVGFYKVSVNMSQVADGGVSVQYTPHNYHCFKVKSKLIFFL